MSGRGAAHRLWSVTSLLVVLHVAVFDLRILTAPDTLQVQYTPDDGYYYLVLARNFATQGRWTFDSGVSTASGFHPLFAYLLALLYRVLHPTTGEFVRCALVVCASLTLATMLAAWVIGRRRPRPYWLLVLALLTSSQNYTYNSTSIMELPLVVLFAASYCLWFCRSYDAGRGRDLAIMFLLGAAGSLARSDFGLLPLSLLVVSALLGYPRHHRKVVATAFAGLAGATLGLGLVVAHTLLFSGHVLQSSARMKAYWAQVNGRSFRAVLSPISLIGNLVGGGFLPLHPKAALTALVGALVAVAFVIVLRAAKRAFWGREPRDVGTMRELTLALGATLALAGYTVLYSLGAEVGSWYAANLIVPLFIVLVTAAEHAAAAADPRRRRALAVALSVAALGLVGHDVASAVALGPSRSPWPWQQFMVEAGKELGRQAPDGRVGAWNAGIIGYYQGGRIVGLDGLVNDDIYAYAVENRLPAYLAEKDIAYVVDFENRLARKYQVAGGYDDAGFVGGLQPVKVFDDGRYSWRRLTLYRVTR